MTASVRSEIRQLGILAIPLIIGQASNVGMSFVDALMAGRLSTEALAAVAIGATVWNGAALMLIGTLLAVPALISNLDGAGQRERMAPLLRQALWMALLLALILALLVRQAHPLLLAIGIEPEVADLSLGYVQGITWGTPALGGYLVLRFLSDGIGLTRPTMYIGLFGMLLNIPADYVLMFGKLGLPAMGARGTGLATALVTWCQLLIMAAVLHWHRSYRFLGLFARWQGPDWSNILMILRLGLPIGGAIFIESSMFMVATLLMGTLGTATVAGHQVALNFAALLFMIPLGISLAITIRVGNPAGRGDYQLARFRGFCGFVLVLMTQLVTMAILLTIPASIAALYTDDPVVSSIAITLLFYAAIFQLPDGLQVASAGALRALKDTAVPMVVMVLSFWVLGIPLSYYLGITMGQQGSGIWIGMIAGLTVATVLLGSRFLLISRRRLQEHVASDGHCA